MYNLQWNGAGLSVLPSEDDIYTQHVKMEFSYNTKNGHCNVQCNFSSQDCRLHTSLPPLPIMQTTYPLHKYLQMDHYYKHMTVDVNSFHAL